MGFLETLRERPADQVVAVDGLGQRRVTVGDIVCRADELAEGPRMVTFLAPNRDLESILELSATLCAGHPTALLDPRTDPARLQDLITRYAPERLILPTLQVDLAAEYSLTSTGTLHDLRRHQSAQPTHADLRIMLTTSGTTGSPKFVRLSETNVVVNARQIVSALALNSNDVCITTLPLHYSFGMSLLTSVLVSGGVLVASEAGVLDPMFWSVMSDREVTVLPGVPMTYSMLHRAGFDKRQLPHLRALLQAGGRLSPELATRFNSDVSTSGGGLFVMYGQTEASPRMTTLQPAELHARPDSVGRPLQGGSVTIRDDQRQALPVGEVGRIWYRGPNVMMGYATSRHDLALGDIHGDELDTGDLGYVDDEGYLFITGRAARFCKLAGSRVSLDEVEAILGSLVGPGVSAAVDAPRDDFLRVLATDQCDDPSTVRRVLAQKLGVPTAFVEVATVPELPTTPRGKIDYHAIRSWGE